MMERMTRLLLTHFRTSRMCSSVSDCGLRNVGTRTFSRHALPLKEVESPRLNLCKTMSVRTLSVFGVRPNVSLFCNACTAKLQGTTKDSCSQTCAQRWFSVSSTLMKRLSQDEIKKRVDDLTDRFAEARELLGDARESLGSTYFSEDMLDAQEAVSATLETYEALLADLDEDQRNDVIRSIGLRMEELKAQEQAIKDLLD